AARQAAAAPPPAQKFDALGARIGQILTLAEDEAAEIRATATVEIRRKLAEIEATNTKARAEADRYAAETRGAVDAEAARILEDAKRAADQMLDEADRHGTARREEDEAVYERQRAQADQAE